MLEGLPALPSVDGDGFSPSSLSPSGLRRSDDSLVHVLQDRYLLPLLNSTHLYLFPGSVKHLHPEFDGALRLILDTDPYAMVCMCSCHWIVHYITCACASSVVIGVGDARYMCT